MKTVYVVKCNRNNLQSPGGGTVTLNTGHAFPDKVPADLCAVRLQALDRMSKCPEGHPVYFYPRVARAEP